ncbi:MAG: hypothetical protein LBR19_07295 [Bifidobacteriaceae bacterium]|jgi:serpin B|nr:hypothetical protein [Bifidobacteriaceae bacterium]
MRAHQSTRRVLAGLLTLGLAGALAACAGGQVTPGGEPTPSPSPSPSPDPAPNPGRDDHAPLFGTQQAQAVTQFGARLTPLVLADQTAGTNPAWSPWSAYLALAMVHSGARGATAEQLGGLLGGDLAQVDDVAGALFSAVEWCSQSAGEPDLELAAGLWADDQLMLDQAYIDQMAAHYRAGLVNLDLQAPGAAGQINDWIADRTNGLIGGLLKEIPEQARIYGATAIYFKGEWVWEFDDDLTRPRDFTLASGEVVQAESMWMDDAEIATIALDDGSYGAVLPYKGGRFVMVAMVPAGGVESVAWDDQTIRDWIAASDHVGGASVSLPKWDIEATLDLALPLQALGVTDVFNPNLSDLSGIGQSTEPDEPNLALSRVLHATTVKVDEKGTTAAAVTVWKGEGAGAPAPNLVLFDRPFVYAIVETDTWTPLFVGAMNDPTAIR